MRIEEFPQVLTFVREVNTEKFTDRFSLLNRSIKVAGDGLFLELGVHRAVSLNYIAARTDKTVYGFDSFFTGIDEDWTPTYQTGYFKLDDLPDVRDNVELVVGKFQDTLESFVQAHAEVASFIHLDADLYSSTRYALFALAPKIVPGTVLQFDELFWKERDKLYTQEYTAFCEFKQAFGVEVDGIGYCGCDRDPIGGAKFALQVRCIKH